MVSSLDPTALCLQGFLIFIFFLCICALILFPVHTALAVSYLLSFLLPLHVDREVRGSISWQPNPHAVLRGFPDHTVPTESAPTGPS